MQLRIMPKIIRPIALGRPVGGMAEATSGSGGHHARPVRTLCRRRSARRTAGATSCRPLSFVAESARGGRKRTRSTTSTISLTASGRRRRPERHEDRGGACFLFPCKSRSANLQETAGGGAVEGQERAVCEGPSIALLTGIVQKARGAQGSDP
jgi:hypothetical protein